MQVQHSESIPPSLKGVKPSVRIWNKGRTECDNHETHQEKDKPVVKLPNSTTSGLETIRHTYLVVPHGRGYDGSAKSGSDAHAYTTDGTADYNVPKHVPFPISGK